MSKTTTDHRVINWPDSEAPDFGRWAAYPSGEVRKIVIGPSPGDSASKPLKLDLAELASRMPQFPNLTHLYLWQVAGLRSLPPLPAGLRCLDVRGCAELETLPALPESLETLDLGGCASLQKLSTASLPKLERFYFNGCTTLKPRHVETFLEALAASPVAEIDGSGATAVVSLAEFPRTRLRKLVLKGCAKLADATGIADFTALDHLNLAGCTALSSLPDLPPKLRYLELFGADDLRDFMGQDVGPYDRGTEDGLRQNVAKAFHSRKKFGRELAIMPHAKLLLMGDGRMGKSTLAKRLQWEELPAKDKALATHPLKPSPDEQFTHKVRFWPWDTALSLPEKESGELRQRADAAGLALPMTATGLLDGAVRLWDFGGQEIYHHTHRIFAGEGSIFLLVWREKAPDAGPPPADVTPEEWAEWNRQRPLDHWLDYIFSMRPDATVALVCTNCADPDSMASKPDWKARAPKHAKRELPAFHVDSLDARCGAHREYARLVTWIREACGKEARRIGILQPRFFRQVSDLVDGWLAENSRARHEDLPAKNLLLPWADWRAAVAQAHGDGGSTVTKLDEDDLEAITGYLHDAGHLFAIRHQQERAVLVDQEWAAELIYRMLLPGGTLRATAKRNGGWFYRADLENDDHWKALASDLQRERLLAYMQESRVVTCLSSARENRFGQDVFLASDKWLLPTFEQVRAQVDRQMGLVRERGDVAVQETFEFEAHALSEFDFRSLQAQLARTFGTRAVYFRNGFQAIDEAQPPQWCFRVRWLPTAGDPFAGKIDAELSAERSAMGRIAEEIGELFHAPGSPLGERPRELKRVPRAEPDFSHEFFSGVRAEKFDVALSSSGADREEAMELAAALCGAGIRPNFYLLPECRSDERERVLAFMNSLREPPCIVLLLSADYLRDNAETNWYCAWELADAIRQLASGKRTAAQTVVTYKKSATFDSKRLNETVVPLLTKMAEFFGDAYARKPMAQRRNFKYYDDFSLHFQGAVEGDLCAKFFEERGTIGTYPPISTKPDGSRDFSAIVAAVEKALGRRKAP